MDYKKHYNLLIDRARNCACHGYFERHHVVPRCLGGDDSYNNLVDLRPEEHYLAHLLLVKMHPGNKKLIYAAWCLANRNTPARNNKAYGWLRRKFIDANTGKPAWNKGVSGYSTKKKGYRCTPEQIENIKSSLPDRRGEKNSFFGKQHTEEFKKARSALYKGKTYEEILGPEKAKAKKEKMSKVHSILHADPEYKKAQSARMTEWWAKRREQRNA